MKSKNVIVSAGILCAVLAFSAYPQKIKAADISENAVQAIKNFTAQTNTSLDKTWTVRFNNEVDEKTIGDNIKVLDNGTGNYLNVTVKLNSDKKSVQVQAPLSGYGINKKYSVLVGSKIASLNGKNLDKAAELDFTTVAIKSTDSIKDVNTVVGTMPTLPTKVNAALTDGTTKAFDIVWDSLSQSDISKAGTVTLSGTLKDTSYKVSININVGNASADDANITFLKQFSSRLESVEANISDSDERNVIVLLKSALDDKIQNPSHDLDPQQVKNAYYALKPDEQSDLQKVLTSNFLNSELLKVYELFKLI